MSDLVSLDDIKHNLRPWIVLETANEDKNLYKNVPEIKEYLETGKLNIFYTKINQSYALDEIKYFKKSWTFLHDTLECINQIPKPDNLNDIINNIIYDCDVYNYLENVYGPSTVDIVYAYKSLKYDEKEFLNDFSKINTRDKKYDFLEKNLQTLDPEVIEFLPLWYRLSCKISNGIKPQEKENLEYKNTRNLGNTDNNIQEKLKNKFIQTFKLGNTYTGQEIKNMVRNIYEDLGIKKTPKISDLQDYFVITSVSISSSYRIDLRK